MKKTNKNINKKILESKKIIKLEKEKIKKEKKALKMEKIKQSRFYKLFGFLIKEENESYSFKEVVVVSICSLFVGVFGCFIVLTFLTGGRNFVKLTNEFGKLFDVYNTLNDNYYDDIDKEKLIEDAIDGMVSSVGDIYTSYTGSDKVDEFDEMVNGEYEGIGCTIQLQEIGLKVIEIFPDSPAEKGGLKVDDLILKVDDIEITQDTNVTEISNYIKTQENEKIKMIISRDEEEKELNLKRDKIETPVVSSIMYEKNGKKIGYLGISLFTSVASKQFEDRLEELEKRGIEGLVIDVRGNNGGYLTTVTDILSQLLPKGNIIYQIEKDGKKVVTKDKTSTKRTYPITVLVNSNSASASEMLAAAIKESYDGYVVGTTTYGKGTVQQVRKLSDGSMVKFTVENWLTPDGNWINDVGVEPTHIEELDNEYYEEPLPENDNQLFFSN